MKGLNFKSNLKPVPNSFMSADQWSEEVKKQKRREQREDWRLKIDEPFYCIPFNIFFRGTKGSTRDTEHRDHQIPLVPNKDYLLWGEDNTKEKLFEGKDDQSS